ncbi:MAG: hypothetical protein HYY06_20010 [Deltaproteobacteria bacterium]|nr:hypothetical protein [Deltaproteobacteria bacterium]
MNWIRGAALRPVDDWAVVPPEIVQGLSDELTTAGEGVRQIVDQAYREFDARQPIVAAFAAERINPLEDPTAVALGYFLSISVFMMFDRAFGGRMRELSEEDVAAAREALDSEDELRQQDPSAAMDSEDVVASQQPHVLAFVRRHLDAALEPADGEEQPDEEEVSEEEGGETYDDTMGEPIGVIAGPELISDQDQPEQEENDPAVNREELGAVYDAILVEVVALSHGIEPPTFGREHEDGTQEPQA